jgi:hypothetical protein
LILVRQARGERATLDTGTSGRLQIYGAHTWYWGFEITSSAPGRWGAVRGLGIDVYDSDGIKLINLVQHDTQSAIGCWVGALNAEIAGCLVYHNGYDDSARGHGHAIYTQNSAGVKRIVDNIMFGRYSHGVHSYTEQGRIDNFHLEGNVSFNNGAVSTVSGFTRNLLIGGGDVAEKPVVAANYTYFTPSLGGGTSCDLGYGSGVQNAAVRDNYFVGGGTAFRLSDSGSPSVTGNTFYGATSGPTFAGNTYHGTTRPAGTRVFVRPNPYEPGRAHLCVFNWDNADSVSADVSSVLVAGDTFEVRDAQNFYGLSVASGTYAGAPIALPANLAAVSPVVGSPATPAVHTPKEFNVYVLLMTSGQGVPPPAPGGGATGGGAGAGTAPGGAAGGGTQTGGSATGGGGAAPSGGSVRDNPNGNRSLNDTFCGLLGLEAALLLLTRLRRRQGRR